VHSDIELRFRHDFSAPEIPARLTQSYRARLASATHRLVFAPSVIGTTGSDPGLLARRARAEIAASGTRASTRAGTPAPLTENRRDARVSVPLRRYSFVRGTPLAVGLRA
jgi:hypothetical protein